MTIDAAVAVRTALAEVEETALGDLLLSSAAREEAVEQGLTAEHFHDPTKGAVCGVVLNLHNRGQQVDVGIVVDELRHVGRLEDVGGAGVVQSFMAATPGPRNARRHIANVLRAARTRKITQIISTAERNLAKGAYAAEVAAWVRNELDGVEVGGPSSSPDPALIDAITADLGADGPVAEVLALELGQKVQRTHLERLARRIVDQRQAERDQQLDAIATVRADVFVNQVDDPVRPLLGTLMSENHNLTVAARFKVGKTKVAENAVAALVTGTPFLGRFAVDYPHRVVLLNYELTEADQRRRLRALGLEDHHLERLHLVNLRGRRLVLTSPSGRDHLVDLMAGVGADVLVIDTYGAALSHCGLREKENDDARQWTNAIDEIKLLAGCPSCIVTAHTGRAQHEEGAEHARGATVIDDWPDVRLVLTKDTDGGRFIYTEGRATDLPESRLRFDEATGRLDLMPADVGLSRRLSKADTIIDQTVALVAEKPGLSKRQIEDQLRAQGVAETGGRNAAREAIALAERRSHIHHHVGARAAHLLYLGAVHHEGQPCPADPS